eukprot:scaffold12672_cov112-Isochrysis_galbana.AAC.3
MHSTCREQMHMLFNIRSPRTCECCIRSSSCPLGVPRCLILSRTARMGTIRDDERRRRGEAVLARQRMHMPRNAA